MKKINLIAVFGISIIVNINTAYALTTTVCNKDSDEIAVDWTAFGCADIQYNHSFVCEAAILQPGECKSYTYPALSSNDTVHVGKFYPASQFNGQLNGYYVASEGHGNCQYHSDGKTTYVTHMRANVDRDFLYKFSAAPSCDLSNTPPKPPGPEPSPRPTILETVICDDAKHLFAWVFAENSNYGKEVIVPELDGSILTGWDQYISLQLSNNDNHLSGAMFLGGNYFQQNADGKWTIYDNGTTYVQSCTVYK